MERGWVFALIVLCSMGALAQPQGASGWTKLIDEGKCKEAEKLCTASLNATSILEQTEAHKCLANVALCGHSIIQLEGDDVGGGNIHGGYEAAATSAEATSTGAMRRRRRTKRLRTWMPR